MAASPSARLTYVRSMDAASCPDESALRKAVAVRFGYDPFFPWAKKTVVVHIGHEGRQFVAHVELVDDAGLTRGTRDLRADDGDCTRIFDATALAISIALDAFAASSNDASPTAPPPEGPPSPEGAPAAPFPPSPTPAESTSPTFPQPSRSPFMAGADVLGSLGAAPGGTAGVGVFVGAQSRSASFELRLHADASPPVAVGPAGRAETARFAATVAPCARFGVAFACGIGELGLLRAWGSDLNFVSADSMAFLAAGGRLGVAFPVSDAFFLRIYAEGVFDLDRARFELDYYDVWTAPLVEGTLAVGLARRIP